ncbi:Cellular tumor antigen p53, variant 2 [Clonorchis sinensis]|uniref:Cellular tumor antigen p53, variant 2 n=1 Tax=Clonorchis sinensis TaxID=79923 RepID=A0A8T1MDT4_CLOSI|nr:Cellular tumor antigen p53, variant 2 [Clonorchis sinensis]
MERVLSRPGDSDPILAANLHSGLRPLQQSFPDRISQLINGAQNNTVSGGGSEPLSGGTTTSFNVGERARTGLALAMDLIRMPNVVDKTEHPTSVLSTINRTTTPVCSPPVVSTPGTYTRHSSGFNVSPNGYTDLESAGPVRADAMGDTAHPPKKLTSDDIPVLDSFPGYYGFDLYRPLCGDTYEASDTKPSTAFFFFKDEHGWTNLYSKKTPTWWTLSYWCQRQPPEGSFIRLTPVYGTADKQQEVIQRCFEDFMSIPTSAMSRYSIVLVGNSLADYFFDPVTERLCVTLPYERPKEGCEYSQFNGKFMCFNSCLYNGGQGNKKPLFLIITLERLVAGTEPSKGQCEVLGRQCIKFRSCACPKRDKENSERRTGELGSYHMSGFGKRKKDGDRTDRSGKKGRSHSIDFTTSIAKSTRHLTSRWGSPTTESHIHGSNMDDGFEVRHNADQYGDAEAGQTVVNYNGRSYHLLLVPTGLPGGIETLSGVRLGLLRTWLYTSANSIMDKKNGGLINTGPTNQTAIKPEVDADKETTLPANDSDGVYSSPVNGRASVDSALQQLLVAEMQLAHVLRERFVQNQGPYHHSRDSTDSQPNSDGAVGLGLGSLDESVNPGQEFSQACAVGPLSSDSGISTDLGQQHHHLSHPQQLGHRNSMGFTQQSHLISDMFSAAPTTHRGSILPGTAVNTSSAGSYEVDYASRFSAPSNSHLYTSNQSSEHPADLRSSLGYAYPAELIETYALVQQASASPGSTISSGHPSIPAKPQSVSVRNAGNRQNIGSSMSVPESVATALSVNLNHAFTSSAFYPTHYFTARPNSSSDQTSSLLDNFSRNQLVASVSGAQSNFCFHPSVGNGALAETLLLPEEVLSSYLERDKGYDEANGVTHTSIGRHPYRRSPSYSSSPPVSPNSACCEKVVILDM